MMLQQIRGLHHITSMAGDAQKNNDFFTKTLGLRRVKKTVNFDSPDVYHLYYGDEAGTPGSVMTYFPFPHIARGKSGTGEVGETLFAVPKGSIPFWKARLSALGVGEISESEVFGERQLHFVGPDHDAFALVEVDNDDRAGWLKSDVAEAEAIRGFHGASLRLRDSGATSELLGFMGYEKVDSKDDWTRFTINSGNGADIIDIQTLTSANSARQGAGSVHHIAFAVENRAAQLEVRKALMDTGYNVTPVIDRNYFWAIYFRTPGGVLFEIATNEPGFDADEDTAHLGEALKLPPQYENYRTKIEDILTPIED